MNPETSKVERVNIIQSVLDELVIGVCCSSDCYTSVLENSRELLSDYPELQNSGTFQAVDRLVWQTISKIESGLTGELLAKTAIDEAFRNMCEALSQLVDKK